MSTIRHTDETVTDESRELTPAGTHFGTDGAGFEHYYQSGSRRMTVVDQGAGESKTFKIPHIDNALVEWAINTIVQHDGATWQEIALDPERAAVLTGDVENEQFEERLDQEGI